MLRILLFIGGLKWASFGEWTATQEANMLSAWALFGHEYVVEVLTAYRDEFHAGQ